MAAGRDERDAAVTSAQWRWTPDVAAFERAQSMLGAQPERRPPTRQCTHRGACYHVETQTTTFPCNMGFRICPFDRQLCHIRIGVVDGRAHDRCAQDVLPRPINCTAGLSPPARRSPPPRATVCCTRVVAAGGASRRGASSTSSTTNCTTSSSCARCRRSGRSRRTEVAARRTHTFPTFDLQRGVIVRVRGAATAALRHRPLVLHAVHVLRRQRRGDGGEPTVPLCQPLPLVHRSSTTSRPSSSRRPSPSSPR